MVRGGGMRQALAEDGGSQETGKQQTTQGCVRDGGKSGGVLGTSQGRHGCLMWAREDGKEAGWVGPCSCFLVFSLLVPATPSTSIFLSFFVIQSFFFKAVFY